MTRQHIVPKSRMNAAKVSQSMRQSSETPEQCILLRREHFLHVHPCSHLFNVKSLMLGLVQEYILANMIFLIGCCKLQVLFAYVCGLCCCWDMQLLKQAAYANRFGSWFLSDFQVIALMASLAAHRTPDQHVLETICVRMVAGTSRAYFVLKEAKTCRNTIRSVLWN